MPQRSLDESSDEVKLQWVKFHGEGVLLEGLKFQSITLEAGHRKADWPRDYQLPDMIFNTKTGMLIIGRDRICAGAIKQYRI